LIYDTEKLKSGTRDENMGKMKRIKKESGAGKENDSE
jgi:hypothetical protein